MPTKRKNAHIAWPTTKGDAQNAFMKYVFCLFYLVAFCVDEPTFFIVFFFHFIWSIGVWQRQRHLIEVECSTRMGVVFFSPTVMPAFEGKKRNSDNHMKKWISRSARIRLWVKRIFIARTLNKPKMHFNSVFGKQYSCVISFTIQRCSVIFHF